MGSREQRWRQGEDAAWATYRRRGFRLVDRNWRSALGELDLVVGRNGVVVFCEVKARGSAALGGPFEAVTAAKRRKLRLLAQAYVTSTGIAAHTFRFDVASVRIDRRGNPDVYLFEDAF
ncbi:MAG: YraN family protein [Actinomycetota bacterium]